MPRVTFALAEGGDLPRIFAAVSRRFHTPWFSILAYASAVWGLALVGSFAWNVTLSVVARLFYYGVVCAALIPLRWALRRHNKLPGGESRTAGFRLPGGPVWAVLGVLITLALAPQADFNKSVILGATAAGALLNWLSARHRGGRPL